MKKITLGIIAAVVFIFIGVSVFVYYYTKKETQTPISQAENLFDSSLAKYSQAMKCWDENDYTGAKIKLAGAKTDVKEGRKYLEKAIIEPA